jgi:hypothetical protein
MKIFMNDNLEIPDFSNHNVSEARSISFFRWQGIVRDFTTKQESWNAFKATGVKHDEGKNVKLSSLYLFN